MIEIVRTFDRVPIRSVLLDFDGTLSLIREGWQEVMVSFMTGILLPLDSTQTETQLRHHISEYVTRLTGKQTQLRGGHVDEWKRKRLIAAGADVIVPDFSEQESLVAYLSGERASVQD